ncbi:hypothetical protein, partial [Microbacterium lacusdiani]
PRTQRLTQHRRITTRLHHYRGLDLAWSEASELFMSTDLQAARSIAELASTVVGIPCLVITALATAIAASRKPR